MIKQFKIYNPGYEVEPDYEGRPNRATRRDKLSKHPHRKSVRLRFHTLTSSIPVSTPTQVFLIFHPTKVSTSEKRKANRKLRHRQNASRKANR